jgi:hypothetical protein
MHVGTFVINSGTELWNVGYGKIIKKILSLQEDGKRLWIGLIWLRVGTDGGSWTFGLYKRREIT